VNEKFRSVISHSQDDKVKIVYSWFGPRGPVWNTELPNILTFSGEAEGVNPNMTSRHFWSDDIWMKQFSKAKDKYELTPCQGIESDALTPFIYPFSMTWRLTFEAYFIKDSGVLEFSHMPKWLIHMCSVHNGYILIDHSVEAFMGDAELHAMFAYFHKSHHIPMYKIIYLTGTVNATTVYEKFCEKNNIVDDRWHRMHVIPYASSREIFHNFYNTDSVYEDMTLHDEPVHFDHPVYDTTHVPQKVFLTWNRRFRRHRTSLALLLEKNNLIDKSLISFSKVDGEMASQTVNTAIESIRDPDGLLRIYQDHRMYIDEETIERFAARCPLEIDGETNINKMCEDYGYTQPYYKETLVSIITETNYDADECTLTEKSFKPLFNKHPFIIVGVPGSVQGLRDLGFQTFSEFWSEDYDTMDSPSDRFREIERILVEIGSWTPDQILDFKRRAEPIVEHNYHMFKEPGSIAVVNNIYEHITKNFNTEYNHWCNPERRCHFE
jgi:hypothetical protein